MLDQRFRPDAPQRVLDSPPGTFVVERDGTAVVAVNLTAASVTVDLPRGPTDLGPWDVSWPRP